MWQKSVIVLVFCVASTFADDCPNAWKTILNGQMQESTENGCDADWKFFSRPSGGWCMRVFTGYNAAQADAEKACQSVGATLSGLQNKAENVYVQAAILAQIPQDSGSLWLGIQRTKKCLKQTLTATCTPLTSFEWTDNSVTGTDAITFQSGQPDNINLAQNCALFLASKTPTVSGRGTYYAGTFDDVNCVATFVKENEARTTRGYVCGKKAVQ